MRKLLSIWLYDRREGRPVSGGLCGAVISAKRRENALRGQVDSRAYDKVICVISADERAHQIATVGPTAAADAATDAVMRDAAWRGQLMPARHKAIIWASVTYGCSISSPVPNGQ